MSPTTDSDLNPRWLAIEALHTAISRKLDVRLPARRLVESADTEWQRNYGDGVAIWTYVPNWNSIGAALLCGDGKRWAEREWNILDAYDETMEQRLGRLRDLSEQQYGPVQWFSVAWLRILAGDWRPISAKPIAINDFELTRPLLNAVSARDRTAVEKAIRAFERRDRSRPSILGFALRRVLLAPEPPPAPSSPPPLEQPAPPRDLPAGWFVAETAADIPHRLPAVTSRLLRRAINTRGRQAEFLVEKLSCGHVRVSPGTDQAPPVMRRMCLICSRLVNAKAAGTR